MGFVIRELRRRIDDAPTELTISLLGYRGLPAGGGAGRVRHHRRGHGRGVHGWHTPELTTPSTRMQLFAVWELGTFLLNAVLFLLVGLQLQSVLDEISGRSAGELAGYAALVCAAVILVRLVWEFTVPQASPPRRSQDGPAAAATRLAPAADHRLVRHARVGGAGRGAGDPLTIEGGAPFPDRDLVLFLTFSVIVVTLVFQGLTLKPLVRWLDVDDDGSDEHEAQGPAARGGGRAGAARGWWTRTGCARTRSSAPRPVRLPSPPLQRALRRVRRRGLRRALCRVPAAVARAARRRTRRAARCATRATSATRCAAGWSATWTWRSRLG